MNVWSWKLWILRVCFSESRLFAVAEHRYYNWMARSGQRAASVVNTPSPPSSNCDLNRLRLLQTLTFGELIIITACLTRGKKPARFLHFQLLISIDRLNSFKLTTPSKIPHVVLHARWEDAQLPPPGGELCVRRTSNLINVMSYFRRVSRNPTRRCSVLYLCSLPLSLQRPVAGVFPLPAAAAMVPVSQQTHNQR